MRVKNDDRIEGSYEINTVRSLYFNYTIGRRWSRERNSRGKNVNFNLFFGTVCFEMEETCPKTVRFNIIPRGRRQFVSDML